MKLIILQHLINLIPSTTITLLLKRHHLIGNSDTEIYFILIQMLFVTSQF